MQLKILVLIWHLEEDLSFNLGDVIVPEEKEGLIADANKKGR